MTKLLSSLSLVLLLATSGCQKSADLGRMQQETLAVVKVFANQLDIEQRRADELLARGREVASTPGANEAGGRLTQARAELERLRGLTSAAPSAVATAAKSGSAEELKKVSDEMRAKLVDGLALVRADLAAVRSWVAYAEMRPTSPTRMPPPATEPPATEPPADPAAPTGSTDPAAPAGGAPAAPAGTPPT